MKQIIAVLAVWATLTVFPNENLQGQGRQSSKPKPNQSKKVQTRDMTRLLIRFDKNKDQMLDESELPANYFRRLRASDVNKDGKLSRDELKAVRMNSANRPSASKRPGEVITGPAKGERYSDTLKVGQAAPNFTLSDPAGGRKVTLSAFQGKRPVVLIFGSYT